MKKLNIVVADDSKFMRILVKRIVERMGHRVVAEASNGRELVEIMGSMREKPDLVFLDINMPEMDGLKTLEAIRIMGKNVKVVIVSALGQDGVIKYAKSIGVVDFITKPFTPDKIMRVIKSVAEG
ncbi:MAG: two-component system response regulator [Thermoprotei archaeon]|nr:MAG: two-component system response regulator [Thermoprotei archaeon]